MTARQRVELCMAVDEFTQKYAKLLSLKLRVEDGVALEDEDLKGLASLTAAISADMTRIRQLEELFGYESVGIPVNESSNFYGFSIVNGELVGDLSYAYQIAEPWYCGYYRGERTDTAAFFKFFIAAFIIHLTDMYCPSIIEEIRNPNKKKKQDKGRKPFGWFSSLFHFKKGA